MNRTETLRIAGIVRDSIVDGDGLRFTVFTQGCPHHCPGCHNPQTWGYRSNASPDTRDIDVPDLETLIQSDTLIDGVTFSGGEPFEQAAALAEVADWAHGRGLSVWCYTGWTYEELIERDDPHEMDLLQRVDVLIDGRFELDQKTYSLPWRGSKNQRLLRLKGGRVESVE